MCREEDHDVVNRDSEPRGRAVVPPRAKGREPPRGWAMVPPRAMRVVSRDVKERGEGLSWCREPRR